MIFDIQYKEPKVYDGYAIAGEILCGPDIIERIEDVERFTYTKEASRDVARTVLKARENILNGSNPKIVIKDYFYPSKSVIATTDSRYPNTILVNRKNVWKYEVVDYIRNGAHEAGHCPFGYGHGSNWPQNTWKGRIMRRLNGDTEDMYQSVPCLLEELVLQLAKEKGMV